MTNRSSIKQQLTTICKHGTITSQTTVESHCSKITKNSETASLLSSSIPPDCLTMIKIGVNTTSELEGYFSPSFFRAGSSIQSCYRSHEASIIYKQYALGARGFSMATKPTRLHLGVVGQNAFQYSPIVLADLPNLASTFFGFN